MDEHVIATYRRAPEVFVAGEGAVLRDAEGHAYLDFLGGLAVSALGHAHPKLVAALRDQAGKVLHVSNLYRHPYTEELASRLAELTGLAAAFFTNSGTEAVEAALKLARKAQRDRGVPGRTGFVALEGSFHGRSLGALSVTHAPRYREPFGPLLEARFVPFGDISALETAVREARPAAVLLEPIQGEGGVRELPHAYLRHARALCDATETVLIHDEIQCGCGRTGSFLAADAAGVKPDVLTLAKPLGGGLPMGCMMVSARFAEVLGAGDHGSTFAGGPLACRAALVFTAELQAGLLEDVRARGAQLRTGLERLARECDAVAEVRGRGLLLGLRMQHGAGELQAELHRERLLANCTAGDVLRLLPPFVITEAQVDDGLRRLRRALTRVLEARHV